MTAPKILHLKIMAKSQKITKIPEVLVSFLESINLISPLQKRRKHKKLKTKNDFHFIVFPFMYEKTQKRENKNRAPFYLCSVFVRTNTKNGKTTNDFLFIVFPLMYENTQIFIFQISLFRFLWLFKWTKSWDREGVEGGGGGGFSGGWLFLSETSLRVVGQQFL